MNSILEGANMGSQMKRVYLRKRADDIINDLGKKLNINKTAALELILFDFEKSNDFEKQKEHFLEEQEKVLNSINILNKKNNFCFLEIFEVLGQMKFINKRVSNVELHGKEMKEHLKKVIDALESSS